MNNPLVVRGFQRQCDLSAERQDVSDRKGAFANPLCQCRSVDQFHDEDGRALVLYDVVQRRDVGVVQGGNDFRLPVEAPQSLGSEVCVAGSTLRATWRGSRVSRAR